MKSGPLIREQQVLEMHLNRRRLLTGCLMKIFMIISSGIFSDIFGLGFGLLGISIATVLCRVESSILGEEEHVFIADYISRTAIHI